MSGLTVRRPVAPEPLRRTTRARAVTVVVLGMLVLAACGTSNSSPTAMPTPKVGDVGWKIYGGAGLPSQTVLPAEMAVRNGTVVLVGLRSGSPDNAATVPLWASTNGGSWTPATVAGAATGAPMSVVAFADGFVAVGSDECQASFYAINTGSCRPAIWRSTDGTAWTRISLTEPVNAQLTAVTAWKGGLIAVGARRVTGNESPLLPVLLRSVDGTTWQQLTPSNALDGPLTDAASDGDQLIVVGLRGGGSSPSSATAWSSTDAVAWTREPLPGASQGAQWVAVSAMPGGFGALDVRPSRAIRLSGSLWRRDTSWHAINGAQEVAGARLMGIAAGPFGAVAVGLDEALRPVVYASQDGRSWGPVSPAGALPTDKFGLISATWADGRFLVSGMNLVSYQPVVLAGMAYVPRPGELPYVTPAPTPTPTPGPTPMPPTSNAIGNASVTLTTLAGFVATKGGSTQCQSSPGGQAVVRIDLYDVGTLSGQPVRGGISFAAGAAKGAVAQMDLTALRVDNANEAATSYAWSGSVSTVAADGRSGTVTLDREAGKVAWSCGAWIDPTTRPGFFGSVGQLSLAAKTSGWQSSAGQATCGSEFSGEVGQVSGAIGTLNGAAVSMDLPLPGRSRVGQPIVATLRSDATPERMVRALVTLTRVGPGDVSGTGTFSLRFAAPVAGWPDRLDGTLTWRCPGRTDTDAKPIAACKEASGPAPGANLAAGASSTVSAELASEPGAAAFDGDPNRAWNAGTYAIQWIEVDLGKLVQVGELRLMVAQTPAGHTEHHLYGRATKDAPLVELTACGGVTNDSMTLVMTVSPDAKPMRYLRIETVASPSWVAWREIQVFAAE